MVLPDSRRGYARSGPGQQGRRVPARRPAGTPWFPGANPPIFEKRTRRRVPAATVDNDKGGTLAALNQLNHIHADSHPGDSRLDARISGYELAAKLQLSAPEVLDIASETEETKKLYGLDHKITEEFGRNCLITRRLLERGVRFVQLLRRGGQTACRGATGTATKNLYKDHAR